MANSSSFTLPPREIPCEDWDVVVVGGGPAGCAAAAASASEGARTLLIEATGALGGMGTLGLVPAWCPFSDKAGKLVYQGLAQKVFEATKRGMPHVKPTDTDWVPIDPERLKRVYDELVTEAGAQVRFHTALCGVEKEGDRVSVALASNKAGLTALRAKVFVDASGDADVVAWAGGPFHKGEEGTGALQPATPCFILSGVDDYHYRFGPYLHPHNPESPIHAMQASGKYPLIVSKHLCNNALGSGTVGFNAGHVPNVDATDPDSLSRGLIRGRALAAQMHEALKEMNAPAFAGSMLVATGGLLGIRETRRIEGDYTLTLEDFRARRTFADDIGRNNYYIDVHSIPGSAQHGKLAPEHYGPGESHGIPYRCLLPRTLANVLVAGRSISTDRPTQGSTRVMPPCLVTGEAAGVAAHMASASDGSTRGVDVPSLQARLEARGVFLR